MDDKLSNQMRRGRVSHKHHVLIMKITVDSTTETNQHVMLLIHNVTMMQLQLSVTFQQIIVTTLQSVLQHKIIQTLVIRDDPQLSHVHV